MGAVVGKAAETALTAAINGAERIDLIIHLGIGLRITLTRRQALSKLKLIEDHPPTNWDAVIDMLKYLGIKEAEISAEVGMSLGITVKTKMAAVYRIERLQQNIQRLREGIGGRR